MNCTTTSHWETHISAECSLGGSAICDGYCLAHGFECTCSCHTTYTLPDTVDEVRDWHDEANNVIASFVDFPEALNHTDSLLDNHPHADFAILTGQDRFVIVEKF